MPQVREKQQLENDSHWRRIPTQSTILCLWLQLQWASVRNWAQDKLWNLPAGKYSMAHFLWGCGKQGGFQAPQHRAWAQELSPEEAPVGLLCRRGQQCPVVKTGKSDRVKEFYREHIQMCFHVLRPSALSPLLQVFVLIFWISVMSTLILYFSLFFHFECLFS